MRGNQKGFGLVEVMVGLGIGMLAMVVVMQVFSQSEGQKRTTTGGADALSNGAVALSMFERDIKMSGWGVANKQFSSCNKTYAYCDGSADCGGVQGDIPGLSVAPLLITDGGTKPDSVVAQYFASPSEGSFRYPAATRLMASQPKPSDELNVGTSSSCRDGDLILVQQAGNCTMMQASRVQADTRKIYHESGGPQGVYNPPASYMTTNNWPSYSDKAQVTCFSPPPGGALYQRSYAVDSQTHQLLRSDNSATPAIANEPVMPEVIDIQAEYGIANPPSDAVAQWQPATGLWANPSATDQARVRAVRIALVTRSAQYEKPAPGQACATTTQQMVDGWSAWAKFTPASYGAEWNCYRYKVFETVIPLRNVIWR
jgi:type IV pilus assembly protein PilW